MTDRTAQGRASRASGHASAQAIINLEVGAPGRAFDERAGDTPAPGNPGDPTGADTAPGLPALRQRIAQKYAERYGLTLDPERVIVTAGSSGALLLALTALFSAGDRIGTVAPGYPSHVEMLRGLDLIAVEIGAVAENAPRQSIGDRLAAGDLRGVLMASPASPADDAPAREGLAALIGATQDAGAVFVSDEASHGMTHDIDPDHAPISVLEISDEVYVINAFSDYFTMTGDRVGWMVCPPGEVEKLAGLAQNLFISASHASQAGALAALDCDAQLQADMAIYRRNRAMMLEALPRIGLTRTQPADGALHVNVDVSGLTDDGLALAHDILDQVGVAVTAALDFDPVRGNTTLRLSYARPTEVVEEGLSRLARFMHDRPG